MPRRWGAPLAARPSTGHPCVHRRVRQPGNDHFSAIQRCLSADRPVSGMNRVSPNWGNGIGGDYRDQFADRGHGPKGRPLGAPATGTGWSSSIRVWAERLLPSDRDFRQSMFGLCTLD